MVWAANLSMFSGPQQRSGQPKGCAQHENDKCKNAVDAQRHGAECPPTPFQRGKPAVIAAGTVSNKDAQINLQVVEIVHDN